MTRPIPEIEADLVAARTRVATLEFELIDARQGEIATMVAWFVAGKSFREIGRMFGKTPASVQGTLYRAGWTMESRRNIPARAREHVHQGESREVAP